MTSAQILQLARRRAGITQAELAGRVERPRSNVARWEAGGVKPSFETLLDLVRACELEPVLSLFALDESNDDYVRDLLAVAPAKRLAQQVEAARGMGRAGFDPLEVIRALERQRFDWMLLGRLAANVRASPIVPAEFEVVVYPGPQQDDAEALAAALTGLAARRVAEAERLSPPAEVRAFGNAERWWVDCAETWVAAVRDAPAGTRGFDDLLLDASEEEIGDDLSVLVPSTLDLVRMADASPRPGDKADLPTLRRALELADEDPAARAPRVPRGLEELFAAHAGRAA